MAWWDDDEDQPQAPPNAQGAPPSVLSGQQQISTEAGPGWTISIPTLSDQQKAAAAAFLEQAPDARATQGLPQQGPAAAPALNSRLLGGPDFPQSQFQPPPQQILPKRSLMDAMREVDAAERLRAGAGPPGSSVFDNPAQRFAYGVRQAVDPFQVFGKYAPAVKGVGLPLAQLALAGEGITPAGVGNAMLNMGMAASPDVNLFPGADEAAAYRMYLPSDYTRGSPRVVEGQYRRPASYPYVVAPHGMEPQISTMHFSEQYPEVLSTGIPGAEMFPNPEHANRMLWDPVLGKYHMSGAEPQNPKYQPGFAQPWQPTFGTNSPGYRRPFIEPTNVDISNPLHIPDLRSLYREGKGFEGMANLLIKREMPGYFKEKFEKGESKYETYNPTERLPVVNPEASFGENVQSILDRAGNLSGERQEPPGGWELPVAQQLQDAGLTLDELQR